MRTLIDQDASAFAFPGGAPAAGIIIGLSTEPVGDDPVDTAEFADFAGLDEVTQFLVGGNHALLEHHTKLQAAGFRFLVHLANVAGKHAGRFF